MTPNSPRRIPTHALLTIGFGGVNNLSRDNPVFDDLLVMIDVINEQVQRPDSLFEPLFDSRPFGGRNDPGQNIEWKNLLYTGLFTIDVKGDAHLQERSLSCLLTVKNLLARQAPEYIQQSPGGGSGRAGGGEHFIRSE